MTRDADTPQSESAAPTSLRERKKARTRAALVEVSQRLFVERSYTGTTLEAISEEVDVRVQTLLRYFDSKAQLAIAPMADAISLAQQMLTDPNRSEPAMELWSQYVAAEAAEVAAPTSDTVRSYVHNMRVFEQWSHKDPVLVAMVGDLQRQLQDALALALAIDADDQAEVADLHSVLVAALLVQGRVAVYERWLHRESSASAQSSLLEDQKAVIDYAASSLPRRGAQRLLRIAE